MATTVAQTAGSPGQLPIPPPWTPKLDKLFEKALAIYDGDSPDRWEKIAAKLPGVDPTEVKKHYDRLIEDLNSIETGRVALPNYHKSVGLMSSSDEDSPTSRKPVHGGHHGLGGSNANATNATSLPSGKAPSSKASDPERRKGIPWSEEEHRFVTLPLVLHSFEAQGEPFELYLRFYSNTMRHKDPPDFESANCQCRDLSETRSVRVR